jgi:hypothetical protein
MALSLGSCKVTTSQGNPIVIFPSNFLHAPHVSTYPSIDVSDPTLPSSLTKLTPPPTKQLTLQTSHPFTLHNSLPRSTSSPPNFQSSAPKFVLQDTSSFHLAPSPPGRDIDTAATSTPTLACTPSPTPDFMLQDASPLHLATSSPSPVIDIAATSNTTLTPSLTTSSPHVPSSSLNVAPIAPTHHVITRSQIGNLKPKSFLDFKLF